MNDETGVRLLGPRIRGGFIAISSDDVYDATGGVNFRLIGYAERGYWRGASGPYVERPR